MFQDNVPAAAFAARRRRVAQRIDRGAVALIQGGRAGGTHDQFRQTNELFYLCGVEVPNAYLVIHGDAGGAERGAAAGAAGPAGGTAALFLPHQDADSIEHEGERLAADNAERVTALTGIDRVAGLEALPRELRRARAIHTPLAPAEGARSSWDTLYRAQEDAEADPFDGVPRREVAFAALLASRYPAASIVNLSPLLDQLRLIKDQAEVAALRAAGRICAHALTEAMRATRPDAYEHELAAVLEYHYRVNGARGASYHPIVAGGQNAWYGHYGANAAPLAAGDLVLVDCGPDYRYYTSDITRMWPVDGTYTPPQRQLYGFMVAYHKALLAGIRAGATAQQIQQQAAAAMADYLERQPLSSEVHHRAAVAALAFPNHLSHPVGMAVHDVGRYWDAPLPAGLVFSVDPQLRVPEQRLYLRVEDTVLVTADGYENLTAAAPLELDEVEAVMREPGMLERFPRAVGET